MDNASFVSKPGAIAKQEVPNIQVDGALISGGSIVPQLSVAASDAPGTYQRTVTDRGDRLFIKAHPPGDTRILLNTPSIDRTRSLEIQLLQVICPMGATDPGFFPKGSLEQVIDVPAVVNALASHKLECLSEGKIKEYAEIICYTPGLDDKRPSYRKIFAILVMIEREQDIVHFVDHRLSDADLPLIAVPAQDTNMSNVNVLRRQNDPNTELACFRGWRTTTCNSFEKWQWATLAPFLAKARRKKVHFYNISEKDILPWVWKNTDKKRRGGFSTVYQIIIHENHHNFDVSETNGGRFALKKFRAPIIEESSDSSEHDGSAYSIVSSRADLNNEEALSKAFRHESEILARFSGGVHPHLISLLAAIQKGKDYYLLFPWAEYDLLSFWRETVPGDPLRKENLAWMLRQCLGVTQGLHRIHNFNPSEKGSTPDPQRFGRHGDIKPENFLLFRESSSQRGTLKITDFGLARFHSEATRTYDRVSRMQLTPTYRPPECDLEGSKVSRAFDIWSLGCVFLEFITWHLGGIELVNQFVHGRKARDIYAFNSDQFFEIVQDEMGVHGARVKLEVVRWIDELHSHVACSETIHKFLDLVLNSMLVVEYNETSKSKRERANCAMVLEELEALCKGLNPLPELLTANPRRPPINTREPVAVEVQLNPEALDAARLRSKELRHAGRMVRQNGARRTKTFGPGWN